MDLSKKVHSDGPGLLLLSLDPPSTSWSNLTTYQKKISKKDTYLREVQLGFWIQIGKFNIEIRKLSFFPHFLIPKFPKKSPPSPPLTQSLTLPPSSGTDSHLSNFQSSSQLGHEVMSRTRGVFWHKNIEDNQDVIRPKVL